MGIFSNMVKKALMLILFFVLATSVSSTMVKAANSDDVLRILQDFKNNRTNTPIRLTSNKNKIIRLDRDAASVVVNNPAHASVMLDTPKLLIIVPHQPGATSFTVLDDSGNTIMEKDIIITNVQPKYVRVRRMCGDDNNCQKSSYFYCPDGCYEVTAMPNENTSNSQPAPLRPDNSFNSIGTINLQGDEE